MADRGRAECESVRGALPGHGGARYPRRSLGGGFARAPSGLAWIGRLDSLNGSGPPSISRLGARVPSVGWDFRFEVG
jgi:hypothetical protein